MVPGPVPLDPECEEELPARQVPQLASCAQRLSDDVHGPQDRKAGPVYERSGGKITERKCLLFRCSFVWGSPNGSLGRNNILAKKVNKCNVKSMCIALT